MNDRATYRNASPAQLAANRLNSEKSAGPRTSEGQAVSSQNAFKTGMYAKALIIRGENPEDFEALTAEYYDRYEPQSPAERDYVDILIRDVWQLRRYANVEAQMWQYEMTRAVNFDGDSPLGQAFSAADQRFARLRRMIAAMERSFKEALRELERLQAGREPSGRILEVRWVDPFKKEEEDSAPRRPAQPVEIPPRSETFGFVPSNGVRLNYASVKNSLPKPDWRENGLDPNPSRLNSTEPPARFSLLS
jgi:hypothetical protein